MKEIPSQIYLVLKILKENDYEGYLVGGAVRNLLLKRKIDDFDITSNASVNVVKALFNNYPLYQTGIVHGTVTVLIDNLKIDITTFRSDVNYIDHRHPETVIFGDNLKDDLKRRDFTINAMCLDIDDNLIDEYDGVSDLNNKLIRAIGDPNTRFYEDALRILRALRFSSKLNFDIEIKTKEAMFNNKDLLNFISMERKKDELLKILDNKDNRQNNINNYLEIYNTFIPFKKVDETVNNFSNAYFALAYLLSKTDGYSLKKLKFSRKEINLLDALIEATKINIKEDYNFISLLSNENSQDILAYLSQLYNINLNARYLDLKPYMVNRNTIEINGQDLMKFGYYGEDIKIILNKLIDKIHHKEISNQHNALIKYLNDKWYNRWVWKLEILKISN